MLERFSKVCEALSGDSVQLLPPKGVVLVSPYLGEPWRSLRVWGSPLSKWANEYYRGESLETALGIRETAISNVRKGKRRGVVCEWDFDSRVFQYLFMLGSHRNCQLFERKTAKKLGFIDHHLCMKRFINIPRYIESEAKVVFRNCRVGKLWNFWSWRLLLESLHTRFVKMD